MIHNISPIIYIGFVKLFDFIPVIKNNNYMRFLRKLHNIILSFLSFIMLIGITYGNYQANKFNSLNDLLCKKYNNNISLLSVKLFLYSKYLEWFDTLFLHLSGKQISTLQYTHHMSTAILAYNNINYFISPHLVIFMSLNCLVHVFMYWYFAYPKGFLRPYRKLITISQIVQHIICITTSFYTYFILDDCEQNPLGQELGLTFYSMYLFYFLKFYINSYLKKNK